MASPSTLGLRQGLLALAGAVLALLLTVVGPSLGGGVPLATAHDEPTASAVAVPDTHEEVAAHTAGEPVPVIGRWLTYIGLFLALGVPLFHRVVLRAGPMPRVVIRTIAAALIVSGVATGVMALASPDDALEVGGGRALLAIGGAAGLLVVRPRMAGAVAAAVGFTGIVLLVLGGHGSEDRGIEALLSHLVHVGAAAVWVSGVAMLVVLTRWPALLVEGSTPPMRALIPRFSALALVSIGLVVLTGVHTAIVETGVILDLSTEFGHTLLMKGGFAFGAMALGALNYLDGGRMMPWLDSLRSRIVIELMLITTVLVMTAALASTPVGAPVAAGRGPAEVIAALLLGGGVIGLVLGAVGGRLPRCEALSSRVALLGGGVAATSLGVVIGVSRLAGQG